MRPVAQVTPRGEGPVTLGIHDCGANFVTINDHMHCRTHFTRAVEGRARVIGGVA